MDTLKPLRFGVLGAAKIARSFIAGVGPSPRVEVVAVASRDLAKGKQFADETGVPRAHGSYEALIDDPDVDAVYVPLPNTLHAEWVIKALNAGKHVLCEKPIAISQADTLAMFDAARRNRRFLAEAYPYRAQQQTLAVRRLLDEGAIGRVQTVFACFGVKFADPSNIRLDPERGGGALLDAGSYATNMVRMVAGEKPTRVNALARWAETKVDLTVIASLEFPGGVLGQISCSFNTAYHRHALIAGTDGIIETTFLNSPPDAGPPDIHVRRGIPATTPRETITLPGGSGFLAEAENFARAVALGPEQWTGSTEQESIETIATLEAIARSIRSGNWENV